MEAWEGAEAITHGAGVEVAAEAPVETIRRPRMTTNPLVDRKQLHQELLPVSKGTGLDSGQVRWAVLPLATLLATEAETSKREIKAGTIRKAEDSLEEQTRVEGSSEIMQEKGVRCGADEVVLDRPGRPSRLQGTKVLGLDPPVGDEFFFHGECRRQVCFRCLGYVCLKCRDSGMGCEQMRT